MTMFACGPSQPETEIVTGQSSLSASSASSAYGKLLGRKAVSEAAGRTRGGGLCYESVWKAMKRAQLQMFGNDIEDSAAPATSAYQFGDYARQPSAKKDLNQNLGLKLASHKDISRAPIGSVIVWKRGGCGFSSVHGHIEIKSSSSASSSTYLCSDFCRPARGCGSGGISAILEPYK